MTPLLPRATLGAGAIALLPAPMLVDYHGPWDEGYFGRRAEGVTALPDRRLDETLRASMFGAR